MLLTDTSHHRFSGEELSLWATMIVRSSPLFFVVDISNACPSDQKLGHWKDHKHPPKVVVEKVYESNPHVQLPANLTGRSVVSSGSRRPPAFNPSYVYPHSPLPGWTPYPTSSPPVPYPPYTLPNLSNAPPYPYLTQSPFSIPSNLPAEGDIRSPSDSDEDLQYPTISEFFAELMETESSEHYFTNYTEGFHDNGYYRVDQLADKSLTTDHMTEIVNHLKEGTARVIKKKALDKVKRIRKGKDKSKK